ncbi:hypothetical protein E2C01_027749 [Portunus trituberculatus]|uniref:Uncharacterized protein n=1 Tax=Portunus trituberculatus TaxID=210409 RepID=A0A5B7EPP5_PORTR|nr:hypothetical protein [Portunus trituberculatus]
MTRIQVQQWYENVVNKVSRRVGDENMTKARQHQYPGRREEATHTFQCSSAFHGHSSPFLPAWFSSATLQPLAKEHEGRYAL